MSDALIDSFKSLYRDLSKADLSRMDNIYSDGVVFKDPIHEVSGLVALQDYMSNVCTDLSLCQFEYLDEVVQGGSAYIKWIMHFRHPKLGDGIISLRGVSHLTFSDKIDFHEDFYDMGAMLYEHIPLLGTAVRCIKKRMMS